MAGPISISYQHFEPNDAVRRELQSLVDRLDRHGPAIVDGRVVLEAAHRHGERTNVEVRVELNLPRKGKAIAKREAEWPAPRGLPSVVEAATEAIRAAEHQVREHIDKLRPSHEVKVHEHAPDYGRVERLNPTVENGFIEMRDGTSLFFSAAVLENAGFDQLRTGDEVLVTVADGEGPYGPQASSVTLRHRGA